MSRQFLIIQGAKQNNLKNINLQIPHNKVTVITGISGSGKSSLAFDTIFAEGQWRYIESLSTYTRMFIEKIDRPDVDLIKNIRPAIAIEQKNPVRTARSTVGTSTEIYDFLRLLFSKIGKVECPRCNGEVKSYNPTDVLNEIMGTYSNQRAYILAPLIYSDSLTRSLKEVLDDLIFKGFFRIKIGEEIYKIPGDLPLDMIDLLSKDTVYVVIDRIIITTDNRSRITDSIEMAFKEGDGSIVIEIIDKGGFRFDTGFKCHRCNTGFEKPAPLLFSFNHPIGACPACKGFGDLLQYDEDLIVPDKHLSLMDGAIEPWTKPSYKWWYRQLINHAKRHDIDIKKPYAKLTKNEKEKIFKGTSGFEGINDFFSYLESKRYKLHVRVFLSRYRSPSVCPSCNGMRLKPGALNVRIKGFLEKGGLNIYQVCSMPIGELYAWFNSLKLTGFEEQISKDILSQIRMKLGFLTKIGLDYLTLHRQTRTLSGGEAQRINLANQLGSRLVGTLYVLDEPSIGLHSRDTNMLAEIVRDIASYGNTVIVVEHDRTMIEAGDYVVEMGPLGGEDGGTVVFSGESGDFMESDCLTSQYIRGEKMIALPNKRRKGSGRFLCLSGAREHNLKNITLKIPLHTFICITGVSGSGKSTLIQDTLYKALARVFRTEFEKMGKFDRLYGIEYLRGVKMIDQNPIGRTPRSNPVTYIKAFDSIRKIFADQFEAKISGLKPSDFSFNTPGGRCEGCQGSGFQKLEMYFFEDLYIKCDKCDGQRYRPEVLKVKHKGKNISEVLNMTIKEALDFFKDSLSIKEKFSLLNEVGLGYIRLGQPATTLSGGEAQRLKICSEIIKKERKDMLYLFDEPTTGLHFEDIKRLIKIFNLLVDSGNTIVVIEHNMDVIKSSDYIIDLGPEGGERGGEIIAEGSPEEVILNRKSFTGRYLSKYLATNGQASSVTGCVR